MPPESVIFITSRKRDRIIFHWDTRRLQLKRSRNINHLQKTTTGKCSNIPTRLAEVMLCRPCAAPISRACVSPLLRLKFGRANKPSTSYYTSCYAISIFHDIFFSSRPEFRSKAASWNDIDVILAAALACIIIYYVVHGLLTRTFYLE